MGKTVTLHKTGQGAALFMVAAKPLLNKHTGKPEYSVKMKFQESSASAMEMKSHLQEIADYKIDTKTNRALSGEFIVNFSSEFEPVVTNADGVTLEGQDIPFFDSRIDTGIVNVTYKVIDYGNTKIVRLGAVQILSLNLAPREDKGEVGVDDIKSQLNKLS